MEKKIIAPFMVISGEMTDSDRDRLIEYDKSGADELLLFDFSETDREHEDALLFLRKIAKCVDAPIICGGTDISCSLFSPWAANLSVIPAATAIRKTAANAAISRFCFNKLTSIGSPARRAFLKLSYRYSTTFPLGSSTENARNKILGFRQSRSSNLYLTNSPRRV